MSDEQYIYRSSIISNQNLSFLFRHAADIISTVCNLRHSEVILFEKHSGIPRVFVPDTLTVHNVV